MSSTNRGTPRRADDHYITPAWCVGAIRPYLPLHDVDVIIDAGCGEGHIGAALDWDGELIGVEINGESAEVARATGLYSEVHVGDFLEFSPDSAGTRALVIANPPFSLALKFVRRAMLVVGSDGYVSKLLRVAFSSSLSRGSFHRMCPSDMRVLDRRPSFCWVHTYKTRCQGCLHERQVRESVRVGKRAQPRARNLVGHACESEGCDGPLLIKKSRTTTTDSSDYAWFSWGPGPRGRWQPISAPREQIVSRETVAA